MGNKYVRIGCWAAALVGWCLVFMGFCAGPGCGPISVEPTVTAEASGAKQTTSAPATATNGSSAATATTQGLLNWTYIGGSAGGLGLLVTTLMWFRSKRLEDTEETKRLELVLEHTATTGVPDEETENTA